MLKLIRSGMYTSVQDGGRWGYRSLGVPQSGAMDYESYRLGNALLENDPNATALEITMLGPELKFMADTYIVISGAGFVVTLDGVEMDNLRIYKVKKGSTIKFGKLIHGVRAYLSVKDGFQVDKVMGSASMYAPITNASRLENGAEIPYKACKHFVPIFSEMIVRHKKIRTLEVYPGPEYGMLSKRQKQILTQQKFSVSTDNNRMGYRLQESIGEHSVSMLTSATLPGTVQHTSSGQLIIFMKDAPTTGGYPRILKLSEESICALAQMRYRDGFRFEII